jgi:cell division protein FtsW (lipid II flippase)
MPSLQPSEFCKLAYIVALAWYLRYRSNYRSFKALIGPFVLMILPMALILPEPDLGTVMLMMPILFVMLFMAGAKPKHLLMVIMMALAVSPFLWFRMYAYQRTRITSVFLQHPGIRQKTEENKWLRKILAGEGFSSKEWMNGDGFNLMRAKYAVASGGLTGYGYRQGPFIKYNFLPERHNDFIFAVIAHQWGFVGCMVVICLYTLIILCGLEIALFNTDPFGRLISIGIVTMILVEVFVHIGMAIGIMPITGLTLPLVSYGGSSMVVSMLAIGLLHNVGRCRPFSVAQKT